MQYRANCSVARSVDVAATGYVEEHSHVAVAADGRFAVAYQSGGNVFVSRYSSAGARLGWHAVATTARTECNASLGIDNYGNVRNPTDNHHGIIGYLDNPDVAKHILDGLGA